MNELTTHNTANAFNAPAANTNASAMTVTTAQSRETAEIQSMMVIAKNFPRDEKRAIDLILNDCQRPTLAEHALYSYSRGGTDVSGPSIHLAKAIAKRWGNMRSGIVELEQRNGESVCEAFALDLESNYKESKIFTVPHIRTTKKGSYRLEDPRDIYELVANNGARRERACLLSIFPSDIVEAAVDQCMKTLKTTADVSPDNIKKMVALFRDKFGVTKEQIEKRIQRRVDTITPAQMVNLRNIYNSLTDGMSAPSEWFDPIEAEVSGTEGKKGNEAVEALLSGKKDPKKSVIKKSEEESDEVYNYIRDEIKRVNAPVTANEVIQFAKDNNIEVRLDTNFSDLVNHAASAINGLN